MDNFRRKIDQGMLRSSRPAGLVPGQGLPGPPVLCIAVTTLLARALDELASGSLICQLAFALVPLFHSVVICPTAAFSCSQVVVVRTKYQQYTVHAAIVAAVPRLHRTAPAMCRHVLIGLRTPAPVL